MRHTGKNCLVDLALYGRVILRMGLKEVIDMGRHGLGFFLAKDTDRWRALMNAVMNFRIP